MRMRAIWTESTLGILDGLQSMHALAHTWALHGPPSAISAEIDGTIHTASYILHQAHFHMATSRHPSVTLVFHHPRLGRLTWSCHESTEDLACLLSGCGLPSWILFHPSPGPSISVRRTRRSLSPVTRFLALPDVALAP